MEGLSKISQAYGEEEKGEGMEVDVEVTPRDWMEEKEVAEAILEEAIADLVRKKELEKLLKDSEDEVDDLRARLDRTQKLLEESWKWVEKLREGMQEKQSQIERLQEGMEEKQRQVEGLQEGMEEKQNQIEKLQEGMEEKQREVERLGEELKLRDLERKMAAMRQVCESYPYPNQQRRKGSSSTLSPPAKESTVVGSSDEDEDDGGDDDLVKVLGGDGDADQDQEGEEAADQNNEEELVMVVEGIADPDIHEREEEGEGELIEVEEEENWAQAPPTPHSSRELSQSQNASTRDRSQLDDEAEESLSQLDYEEYERALHTPPVLNDSDLETDHGFLGVSDEPQPHFLCSCLKLFGTMGSLKSHVMSKLCGDVFDCGTPGCGESFPLLAHLKRHVHKEQHFWPYNSSGGVPRYGCRFCGRLFVDKKEKTGHAEGCEMKLKVEQAMTLRY